jgi:hypothetical protein
MFGPADRRPSRRTALRFRRGPRSKARTTGPAMGPPGTLQPLENVRACPKALLTTLIRAAGAATGTGLGVKAARSSPRPSVVSPDRGRGIRPSVLRSTTASQYLSREIGPQLDPCKVLRRPAAVPKPQNQLNCRLVTRGERWDSNPRPPGPQPGPPVVKTRHGRALLHRSRSLLMPA